MRPKRAAPKLATMDIVRPPKKAKAGRARKPRGFLAARSVPLLYVNVPKSACTTIKNILHRLDSGAFLADPLTIHSRKDLLVRVEREPEEIARRLREQHLVFTFVRHPLRRAYSAFNEKVHFPSTYSFPHVREYIETRYGARFVEAPSLELHRTNFKHFLVFAKESFEGTNGWRRDGHWCPQTRLLNGAMRWRMVDFIGRVENFDAHLQAVLGLAGITCDFEMPRMNEGPPAPYRYEDILDDGIRQLGRDLFKGDLRNFGYTI